MAVANRPDLDELAGSPRIKNHHRKRIIEDLKLDPTVEELGKKRHKRQGRFFRLGSGNYDFKEAGIMFTDGRRLES